MGLWSKRPTLLEPSRTKLQMVLGRRSDRTTVALLLTVRTCSRTEQHINCIIVTEEKKDVLLQPNSCHMVRLVVEEREVTERQNEKSKQKVSTWLLMAALLGGSSGTKPWTMSSCASTRP